MTTETKNVTQEELEQAITEAQAAVQRAIAMMREVRERTCDTYVATELRHAGGLLIQARDCARYALSSSKATTYLPERVA